MKITHINQCTHFLCEYGWIDGCTPFELNPFSQELSIVCNLSMKIVFIGGTLGVGFCIVSSNDLLHCEESRSTPDCWLFCHSHPLCLPNT